MANSQRASRLNRWQQPKNNSHNYLADQSSRWQRSAFQSANAELSIEDYAAVDTVQPHMRAHPPKSFWDDQKALRSLAKMEVENIYQTLRNDFTQIAHGEFHWQSIEDVAVVGLTAASIIAPPLRAFAGRVGLFEGGVIAVDETPLTVSTKHPLEGCSPNQVVDYVNQLGIKAPRDQLILWSGLGRGDAGIRISQQYAVTHGGVTLEMTPGGKWLNELGLLSSNSPFSREEALQIWSDVSTKMIQQASGQVRSLTGTVNPSSIYRLEQEEILMNKNILGLDELSLKPKYYFGNF